MRRLRYLNCVLTVLTVVLTLNLYIAWSGSPVSVVSEARAQGIANAGEQRQEMVALLKQVNVHLADLKKTLKEGTATVRVQNTDAQ